MMNTRVWLVGIGCSLLLTGCPTKIVKPSGGGYSMLAMAPWSVTDTIIPEEQYQSVGDKVAKATGAELKDQLESLKKFDRVEFTAECPSGALRLEGRIASFTHKLGRFHTIGSGKLIDCDTNKVLDTYNFNEAGAAEKMPHNVANAISTWVWRRF